jgi:competence ComEA-like helix-hairpin-helix protein
MERVKVVIIFIGLILLGLINYISAECKEGQIDINSATLGELDKLSGIGPVKAQAIIDARPFEKLEDLINVNGIGNATLSNIKSQGLACVSDEIGEKEEDEEEIVDSKKTTENLSDIEENNVEPLVDNTENKVKTAEVIKLTPQTIKSSENKKDNTQTYAMYGLVIFCILLVLLFMYNRKPKNEFR